MAKRLPFFDDAVAGGEARDSGNGGGGAGSAALVVAPFSFFDFGLSFLIFAIVSYNCWPRRWVQRKRSTISDPFRSGRGSANAHEWPAATESGARGAAIRL